MEKLINECIAAVKNLINDRCDNHIVINLTCKNCGQYYNKKIINNPQEVISCLETLKKKINSSNENNYVFSKNHIMKNSVLPYNYLQGHLNCDRINAIVCQYFDITEQQIRIKKKKYKKNSINGRSIFARQIACYLMRQHVFFITFDEIAQYYEFENYSSVISAVRRVENIIETDNKARLMVDLLEKELLYGHLDFNTTL